jgi:CopG-like RHH_1 or ribbon-helix-helix domain, RHH_5
MSTLKRMATERVTVSLPAEVRQEAQRWADDNGVPCSTVVSQALTTHLRGLAIDELMR